MTDSEKCISKENQPQSSHNHSHRVLDLQRPLLNVKQVAEVLELSTETVIALHKANLAPAGVNLFARNFADCRGVRFFPQDVEAWRSAVQSHWIP